MSSIEFLEQLESVIRGRLADAPAQSYTAGLAAGGMPAIARKVGEEGLELALAAALENDARVKDEAADLVYHLLVLLAARNLRLADVVAVLERRHDPALPRPR